jgi:hypothetical protein
MLVHETNQPPTSFNDPGDAAPRSLASHSASMRKALPSCVWVTPLRSHVLPPASAGAGPEGAEMFPMELRSAETTG